MAGHKVTGLDFAQLGRAFGAPGRCIRAARMEAAARGRVYGAGHVTLKDNALSFTAHP